MVRSGAAIVGGPKIRNTIAAMAIRQHRRIILGIVSTNGDAERLFGGKAMICKWCGQAYCGMDLVYGECDECIRDQVVEDGGFGQCCNCGQNLYPDEAIGGLCDGCDRERFLEQSDTDCV